MTSRMTDEPDVASRAGGAGLGETSTGSDAAEAVARLAAVVANADDAIVTKSLDGIISSWNAGAERIFGYRADEAIGRHISFLIPPDRIAEEVEILERLGRGERIAHFETERLTRDGRRIPISLTISPVRAADGRIIGASKIGRDISERRRFERERDELLQRERAARAAAQAASDAKDQFLAMLAHELRNPIGAIANALSVLEIDRPNGQAHARAVIRRQIGHLSHLLNDLLEVARITSGRIALRRQPIDLGNAIREAVESERHRIRARGLQIRLDLAPGSVMVLGDAVRLHQVFDNLLHNAVKFTPPGGSILVTSRARGGTVTVHVKDTGIGIPREQLESIFELFAQSAPTLAHTEGGLGIGLSLVRKIVALHGGTVTAKSAGPGRGADFVVRLPLTKRPAGETARMPPKAISPRRVLVVDDNADGREMLVSLLRLGGHDVRSAETGQEGLAAGVEHAPSVVFLDIGLPDLDGYQVGRELRQRLGDGVLLVAITGYGQPEDRARALEAGFNEHVVKPVDPVALEELLQSARPATVDREGAAAQSG